MKRKEQSYPDRVTFSIEKEKEGTRFKTARETLEMLCIDTIYTPWVVAWLEHETTVVVCKPTAGWRSAPA